MIQFRLSSLFLIVFHLLHGGVHSQVSISGAVLDDKAQPLPYANALLLSSADSSLIRGVVTDDAGRFIIETDRTGTFMMLISMIGYQHYYSAEFNITEDNATVDLGQITLAESAVLMNTVEVVARKPLFEQRIDRMVVNVANSITSAGTTALEVLERSPGVMVNRQNNVLSLAGKSGVVVMINGRINYMPPEAVVQMLEGMSSDNIEKIEIITTPPAGFDAEGNAGYINIILRKSLDDGFNGSYNLSLGYGKGAQADASVNLNYRKGKSNLYGDYSFFHESQEQVFSFFRRVPLNGGHVETDTRSVRDPNRNNHNARLGFDYQLSDQTVIGVLVSAYNTKWEMDAVNTSLITSDIVPDTNILILNSELNQWKHAGGNINVQHTFQQGGKLIVDFDALWYRDNNPSFYDNTYTGEDGMLLYENQIRSRKITPITIKVAKIDYTKDLGKNIKLETGIKGTLSVITNDVGVDYRQNGDWSPDPDLTAKYDLDEEILAAYVSLEKPLGKGYTFKGGLRYEYTSSNLGSLEQTDIVDRAFGEIFPSIYFSKEFNQKYAINMSYSKRITRPTFNDMAPFVIFVDPYTFFSGNAALQPAISNKIGVSFKLNTAILNLEYAIEDSTIARYQASIVPGTNRQLIFAENLKDTRTWSGSISVPVVPVKWWSMFYNINGSYQVARKYFGTDLSEFEGGGVGIFSTQSFTVSKTITVELTGFYNSGGLFGIARIKSIGGVNIGAQMKFSNGGALRIGYDDLLHTLVFTGETDLPEQDQYFKAQLKFSQPTLKISYSQHFGNQAVKGKRNRGTGAEEERQRIGN